MTVNDTIPSAPVAPTGKWRAILIGSLALNLLVAGVVAGSWIQHKRHHPMMGFGGSRGTEEIGLHGFLRTLPKERASELRALVKGEKPDLKPLFAATRAARLAAADAMAAEPFSKDGLTEAFGKIDAAEANVKAAARTVITAAAGHMTAQERLALSERWKSKRAKFFHGFGSHGHRKKDKQQVPDESAPAAPPQP